MLSLFGITQKEILKEICKSKSGLTVENLTQRLGVTRTAINQHLKVLVRDGFVAKGKLQITKGRPGRNYLLSQRGLDLFPRQYSWFSGLMLEAIKEKSGSKGLVNLMKDTARLIAKDLEPRVNGKDHYSRMKELAKIMNELSYDAQVVQGPGQASTMEATNCVYHSLAQIHPEICEFDIEILRQLTQSKVSHQECMVRGGQVCRFHLEP